MLFADQRHHSLRLPVKDKGGQPANIAFLIHHLCQNVMNDTRKELFVLDDHLYVNLQFCVSSIPVRPLKTRTPFCCEKSFSTRNVACCQVNVRRKHGSNQ